MLFHVGSDVRDETNLRPRRFPAIVAGDYLYSSTAVQPLPRKPSENYFTSRTIFYTDIIVPKLERRLVVVVFPKDDYARFECPIFALRVW